MERQRINLQEAGHTLVEVLVAVTVLGILATLAIPSFSQLLARSERLSAINRLTGQVQLARHQASQHGKRLTFCLSNRANPWQCSVQSDGTQVVFIDYDDDRQVDIEAGELIWLEEPPQSERWIAQLSGGRAYLRFRADGTAIEWGSFHYCPMEAEHQRRLIINAGGRVRIANDATCPAQ